MRSKRDTWAGVGIGLVVSGILGMLWISTLGSASGVWLKWASDIVLAVSVLLSAVGLSRPASVVGRNPVGIVALAVLAVWPFLEPFVFLLTHSSAAQLIPDIAYGYVVLLVPAGAALVSVAVIARARTVPSPWRLIPAWVLAGQAVLWMIPQLYAASAIPGTADGFAASTAPIALISYLAGTIGLGIAAIVLAAKQRPESVEVFASP
jgi:hypothetical protein